MSYQLRIYKSELQNGHRWVIWDTRQLDDRNEAILCAILLSLQIMPELQAIGVFTNPTNDDPQEQIAVALRGKIINFYR